MAATPVVAATFRAPQRLSLAFATLGKPIRSKIGRGQ
jgi:hypothetical protein